MTSQHLLCPQCRRKSPTHQKLFDALYDFQRSIPPACPSCGAKRELHLELDFQLGTGDSEFKVVSAFLPEKLESWLGEEEEEVTFYPFLVVLQRRDGSRVCWLPYWHVTGKEARYGQHAVCLDHGQLDDLIRQAKQAEENELALV